METILQTLREEFLRALDATQLSTHRRYQFPDADHLIKVAIGMRRSGKTYFLFQTMREYLAKGLSIEQIFYLNLEDDRLFPLDEKRLASLVDSWYSLFPENHDRMCYLFLDEVQNAEGWPRILRRLLDTKKIQLFVTGSSAKLLSKEIASSLRGRSIAIEIFPYSYGEYLDAHQLPAPQKQLSQKELDIHRKTLQLYFQQGGFPAIQMMNQKEQIEILQNYVETVVLRDVIERYQISNVALMKYFIHFLLKNIASPFSINKFYKDIKSQGYKIAKGTLYSYLVHLEDAFLLFTLPIFSESLRKSQITPKKIYAVDTGLAAANSFNLSGNFGKFLENLVFLDLRRQGKKIYYYVTADGYEIDFITQDYLGKYEIVQVSWDVNDEKTIERETRALAHAQQELGFPGKLITSASYLQSLALSEESL